MRASALLFVSFCALSGSLALPQSVSSSSVSLPGVNLSPADQTACIQSCSQSVAEKRPDALNACLSTGNPAPNCLCTDPTLAAEMQKCFGVRCPPLQGVCAAILGGSSFVGGTVVGGGSSSVSAGSPGQISGGSVSAGSPGQSSASGGSVSLPDVPLPPAQQTACVQSCSDDVAQNEPDALDACLDATGNSVAECLCTDATLAAEMQRCFASRCPPLQSRCAAIFGGASFAAGTPGGAGSSQAGAGTPGTGNESADDVSFPDVQLPPAQQTACVQSCSVDVAANVPDALDACVNSAGNSAANCLCTDDTLAAEMQKCFAARCAPLQGRCAAIIDGASFIAGTTGSAGSSSSGTVGDDTTSPAGAGTSAPGTVGDGTSAPASAGDGASSAASAGDGAPGNAGADTPAGSADGAPGGSADGAAGGSVDGAAGASGSSGDNSAGGNSPGTSAPDAPAAETDGGGQPSPASGVSPTSSGASPSPAPSSGSLSAAAANPSTPTSASSAINPGAGNPDNSASMSRAAPLALALSLAFGLFL